jgi:hypothetical protein
VLRGFGWFVGWLVGWLVGRSVGRLVGWWVGWLVWSVGWFGRSVGRSVTRIPIVTAVVLVTFRHIPDCSITKSVTLAEHRKLVLYNQPTEVRDVRWGWGYFPDHIRNVQL